jgi:alkanesulfonate monooxygenase SsuD/methylene tetrahydromethanopterin reductase-like flavin-dependent oxidoreductase (luciferase family)
VLGLGPAAYRLAARQADLLFVTPRDRADAAGIRAEVAEGPALFADLVAFLDPAPGAAVARWSRLDELAGEPFHSDARIVAGTAAALADEIEQLDDAGYAGVRLRPAVLPHDLVAITDWLVPELQRRGRFRRGYEPATLRGRLGLARPANRYATGAGQP